MSRKADSFPRVLQAGEQLVLISGITASQPMKRAELAHSPKAGEAAVPDEGRWLPHHAALLEAAEQWPSSAGREAVAQALTGLLVRAYWHQQTGGRSRSSPVWRTEAVSGSLQLRERVRRATEVLSGRSVLEASYCIGLLYTDLLPEETRAARGAYYTPPSVAERLLDLAAGEGVDWSTATVLDPSCGGGAFLVPVAARMLAHHRIQALSPADRLAHVESHLAGIEIDGFAAWMTRAFLDLLALPVSREAGRPLRVPIETGDALQVVVNDTRRFDLVVGNPPYGRVSLSPQRRALFERSLYGHANLYGIFLDAALRWRKPQGLVAFLTPTSFLGGQYYSRLRALLLDEAPPLVIDVVSDRTGVFPAVQQEMCLTVFGRNPSRTTTVHLVEPKNGSLDVVRAGSFPLARSLRGSPWLLPRSQAQARLVEHASRMATRLETLGYRASTGPLVWNRVKRQLRSRPEQGTYPLIWAEAVRPNELRFDYRARAERSFVAVPEGQDHLLTTRPCVLVQRTTAKEQRRRLIACAVPEAFVAQWGAIVVENHVNVLRATSRGQVSPAALAAVLNTAVVDEVFRCLSGSVAVSATELHALPLPEPEVFARIEELCREPRNEAAIEKLVAEAYGARPDPRLA